MTGEIKTDTILIRESPDARPDDIDAEFREWLCQYGEKRIPKYLDRGDDFEQWDSRR